MEEQKLDFEAGISKEDQKEILQTIENVVTENRITTTAEDFIVKAVKRGVLFPVIVIIAAVAALGIGGAAFYFLFQRGESQIVRGAVGTITAEGQLIQAVRREANDKILEKNQEINTIQGRLADIDKQRQDLQSNMDSKVSQKEQELRAQMAAALEAERARLQKEGLSNQAIAQRMQQLETQRSAQLQREMEAYKKTAETERLRAEQNLKTMQQEFTASLAKVNSERDQAISDARKREQELRGQFAQRTQSLESASAQAVQALNTLTAQREKEDLFTNQLVGLYGEVRENIAEREYDEALAGLQSLRDFVNRPDVALLPGLAKRHDVDVFVIDSLTKLVQAEIEKARSDTASLLEAANAITALREHADEAEGFLKAGKTADAEEAYGEALEVIPEVAACYAYFVGRDKEAETTRQARLTQSLERAEAAYKAGALPVAAASYRSALTYLPVSSERLDRAVASIEAAGNVESSQRSAQIQSRSAAGPLSQADALRSQGKYVEALAVYVDLLGQYPLATQTRDALNGIQAAANGMNDSATAAFNRQTATLGSQISSLQQELASRRSEVAGLQDAVAKGKDDNGKLLGQIDSLKGELQRVSAVATRVLVAEQRAQAMQDRFDTMQKSYKDYISLEEPVLKSKGDAGLMDTKPYLDAFFRSPSVQEVFPGLPERMKRYDQGFQLAGRSDAIQDAISVVINFSRQGTQQLKRQFLQQQLRVYAKDPDMIQLLQEMDQRLASR
jgi:hypothetical protein